MLWILHDITSNGNIRNELHNLESVFLKSLQFDTLTMSPSHSLYSSERNFENVRS